MKKKEKEKEKKKKNGVKVLQFTTLLLKSVMIKRASFSNLPWQDFQYHPPHADKKPPSNYVNDGVKHLWLIVPSAANSAFLFL